VTSLYGAFGKFLHDNGIALNEIKQVMLTGVGSAYVNEPIYGLPTSKAEEFMADGLGAQFESKQDRMLVVSMGTGTSFVKVEGKDIQHIGGMGIGGGTLRGLSQLLLNVNLNIGDISAVPLPGLPLDVTASILGKVTSNSRREDIAAGLICTVIQTIGSATYLASLGSGIKDFVCIGNLTLMPQCHIIFPMMEKLYNVRFIIPEYAEFCTAIGAALCYYKNL
jgi:type II pantothenate kinase